MRYVLQNLEGFRNTPFVETFKPLIVVVPRFLALFVFALSAINIVSSVWGGFSPPSISRGGGKFKNPKIPSTNFFLWHPKIPSTNFLVFTDLENTLCSFIVTPNVLVQMYNSFFRGQPFHWKNAFKQGLGLKSFKKSKANTPLSLKLH
jgi:hypothetical protein